MPGICALTHNYRLLLSWRTMPPSFNTFFLWFFFLSCVALTFASAHQARSAQRRYRAGLPVLPDSLPEEVLALHRRAATLARRAVWVSRVSTVVGGLATVSTGWLLAQWLATNVG